MKSRFIRARKISYSLIKPDEKNGGWLVRSSDWRNGPLYYHVYKTKLGVWLCTCEDHVVYNQTICKHMIRAVLWIYNHEEEEKRLNRMIRDIAESDGGILRTKTKHV